ELHVGEDVLAAFGPVGGRGDGLLLAVGVAVHEELALVRVERWIGRCGANYGGQEGNDDDDSEHVHSPILRCVAANLHIISSRPCSTGTSASAGRAVHRRSPATHGTRCRRSAHCDAAPSAPCPAPPPSSLHPR